jgi:hypothetical protein
MIGRPVMTSLRALRRARTAAPPDVTGRVSPIGQFCAAWPTQDSQAPLCQIGGYARFRFPRACSPVLISRQPHRHSQVKQRRVAWAGRNQHRGGPGRVAAGVADEREPAGPAPHRPSAHSTGMLAAAPSKRAAPLSMAARKPAQCRSRESGGTMRSSELPTAVAAAWPVSSWAPRLQ